MKYWRVDDNGTRRLFRKVTPLRQFLTAHPEIGTVVFVWDVEDSHYEEFALSRADVLARKGSRRQYGRKLHEDVMVVEA